MKIDNYFEMRINNGPIDMDGAFGFQCMDLFNEYAIEVMELERGKTGAPSAKELLNNSYLMQNVERINNYAEFVPQKGDIAVWCGGQYGHVAICMGEANLNYFKTLDQNWKPQALSIENHNYLYMTPLVFLRPKNRKNIDNQFIEYNVKITADVLTVRNGAGTNYNWKHFEELTPNAQEQIINLCGYRANGLVKGCEATILEQNGNWGRIPSGWICLDYTERI